jgi:hypothetical protein
MKATVPWAGVLLGTALTASLVSAPFAFADPYYPPALAGPSTGACGPGCYASGSAGRVPQYWFRPTGEPLTPYFPAINKCGPYYVTHPYVRGPRDFFMWRENMEDQMRRVQRPTLVP